MSHQTRFAALCLGPLMVMVLGGCGSDSDLADVSGRVTMDGEPLEGAIVQFQPTADGSSSTGITDADGRYELMHTLTTDGAKLGEHRVTIRTAAIYYEEDDCDCSKADPIPPRYNDRTELVRTVEASDNSFNFELQSPATKYRARPGR